MASRCPHCGLLKPSGWFSPCPSCGSQHRSELGEGSRPALTIGQRIAGFVLILNGIFVIAASLLLPSEETLVNPIVSGIIDLGIGALLAAGRPKVLVWAQIRAILGGIIFSVMYIASGDPFMAGFQFLFSLALVGLLVGTPGKARIGVSITITLLLFSVEIMGIQTVLTGRNLLTSSVIKATENLETLDEGHVSGRKYPYSIRAPNDNWFLRKHEDSIRDNPDVDVWLIKPDYDAHIVIIAEAVDDKNELPLDDLVRAVIARGEEGFEAFTVEQRRPLVSHPEQGERIEASGTTEGVEVRSLYGVFAIGRFRFQIVCWAFADVFPFVADDFERVIESFSFTPGEE